MQQAPAALKGQGPAVNFDFGLGREIFAADSLAVFMALVSSLVGAVIVLDSFDYTHRPLR